MTRGQITAELLRLKSDVCRRVDELVTKLGAPDPKPSSENASPSAFRGKPMQSRYPGRCEVCGKSYGEGDSIVYNGDIRKAAHLGCGRVDARGAA